MNVDNTRKSYNIKRRKHYKRNLSRRAKPIADFLPTFTQTTGNRHFHEWPA